MLECNNKFNYGHDYIYTELRRFSNNDVWISNGICKKCGHTDDIHISLSGKINNDLYHELCKKFILTD